MKQFLLTPSAGKRLIEAAEKLIRSVAGEPLCRA